MKAGERGIVVRAGILCRRSLRHGEFAVRGFTAWVQGSPAPLTATGWHGAAPHQAAPQAELPVQLPGSSDRRGCYGTPPHPARELQPPYRHNSGGFQSPNADFICSGWTRCKTLSSSDCLPRVFCGHFFLREDDTTTPTVTTQAPVAWCCPNIYTAFEPAAQLSRN